MKKIPLLLAVIFSALMVGCTTLADVKTAKGTGTVRIYDRGFAEVWTEVIITVHESGLSLKNEDETTGIILAHRGISAFSNGENVAIFVEDLGRAARVEIVSKPVMLTNITAKNWEPDLIERLDKKLK